MVPNFGGCSNGDVDLLHSASRDPDRGIIHQPSHLAGAVADAAGGDRLRVADEFSHRRVVGVVILLTSLILAFPLRAKMSAPVVGPGGVPAKPQAATRGTA